MRPIFPAEAINRSFNEIKTYVENRRNNLLQSLKTTREQKLKVLNDQLGVINSKVQEAPPLPPYETFF